MGYIGTNYDGTPMNELMDQFFADPENEQTSSLIIGWWTHEDTEDSSAVIQKLVENKDKLPHLKSIFLGDIEEDDNMHAWIENVDPSPLFEAFPNLESFGCKNGEDGSDLPIMNLPNLKSLDYQSIGFTEGSLENLLASDLPNLEDLNIWLGSGNRGFAFPATSMNPIFSGEKFPHLKNLGLMNCDTTDEFVEALKEAPILDQLETLNLSMGTLSDVGAQTLLDSPKFQQVQKLNIKHHFLTKEMQAKVEAAFGKKLLTSESEYYSHESKLMREDGDEDFRYVEVAE